MGSLICPDCNGKFGKFYTPDSNDFREFTCLCNFTSTYNFFRGVEIE